jgi:hypothetical protein
MSLFNYGLLTEVYVSHLLFTYSTTEGNQFIYRYINGVYFIMTPRVPLTPCTAVHSFPCPLVQRPSP